MRKLVIAAAVSMSLATLSANTHALNLGEIEMYSALNQSLDAEINFVSYAPGELEGITATLASAEAFAAAGLQRSQILSAMRFDVERRPDGVPVVKVTSDAPISEPFLSFLLQVETPQGNRLVREYTVLLDPPVFTAGQSELVVTAPVEIESASTGVGISTPIERNVGVITNVSDVITGVPVELEGEMAELSPVVTFAEQKVSDNSVIVTDNSIIGSEVSDVDLTQDTTAGYLPMDTSAELEPVDSPTTGAGVDITELVLNLDNPVRVGSPASSAAIIRSEPAPTGGENLDLVAELVDQTPQDNSVNSVITGGIDVALDDLAGTNNAIFDNEEETAPQDTAENIVALDSLENISADMAPVVSSAGSYEVIGESVDIGDLTIGSNAELVESTPVENPEATYAGAEIDLNGSAFEPEVTLETVTTTTIPYDRTASATAEAEADPVLGVGIDISGIILGEDENQVAAITEFKTDSYRVKADDTLWSIARTQKTSDISTQQMVVAILEANPDAFVDGDMNRLRDGAELRIPGSGSAISDAEAIEMVREQAPVETAAVEPTAPTAPEVASKPEALTIVGVDDSAAGDGTASAGELSGTTDLDRELESVNKKMILAQEELASESLQRDELSSRVVELEDSLAGMKKLITLRESELGNLQAELDTAKTDTEEMAKSAEDKARELAASQAEKDAIQADLKRLEENIAADASIEQERIDAKADADKNQASAEAEVLSVRLATEENALKSQLAQLQVEKAQLIETAQNDKLELLQQSEAEKAQLLAEAKAERERITAELEAEKARITEAAKVESARVAAEARAEKEQLLAEANAERDRLAAESAEMRTRLEALELEQTRLLAEAEADKEELLQATKQAEAEKEELLQATKQAEADKEELLQATKQAAEEQARIQAEAEAEKLRLEEESSQVKDRLAALQAEANANLSDAAEQGEEVAANVVDTATEAGADVTDSVKEAAGAGAAVATGLLAAAPLQDVVGERKNVLAAGGGLALVGLLGAWAMRRRRKPLRDIPLDIDTDNDVGRPSRARFDTRSSTYEEAKEPRSTMSRAAVAASAAAAASGAAASREDSDDHKDDPEIENEVEQAVQTQAQVQADAPEQVVDDSLLDDTITEADVYLRYGLHGQAEDLLTTAIERSPDNEGYHLKLLESYHENKNTEDFKSAATNYHERFGNSSHWERVTQMGRAIDPGEKLYAASGSTGSGAATSALVGGAAAVAAAAGGSGDTSSLDATIDAGAEFNVDDLSATGGFDPNDDSFVDDLDDISLDEVDLASLDDDGTMNLDEIAGNQMSGLDLGSLDLTNPDGDSTLDNLTLDDADLNSLGDVTSSVRSGLESDLDFSDNPAGDSSEMETMLDLAKAYIDMGDSDSAANALRDIAKNGNAAQQQEATDLLKNLT